MRSAAVVFNPFAGRRRSQVLLTRVIDALSRSGFETEPLATRGPGDAASRAREAAANGAEVVFSLGGDGTLRECAAGLLGSETALSFLPTGTINVMAMELGVPMRPVAAAYAYSRVTVRSFGVGLAGDIPFLMQVSAGVDAFLVAAMKPGEKKFLGRASTVPAIVRSLLRYSFPSFQVTTPSGTRTVTLAVASNIVRYGGPWKLAPGARSDGEGLELLLFSGRGRVAAIRFALSLLVGRQMELPGSRHEHIRRATIAPVPGLPFQVDGDVMRPTQGRPLEVSVSTDRLRMLVPAK